MAMLLVGYIIERIYIWYHRRNEIVKTPERAMTLSEWRTEYKAELCLVVQGIFHDVRRIKDKIDGIQERFKEEIEYYQLWKISAGVIQRQLLSAIAP